MFIGLIPKVFKILCIFFNTARTVCLTLNKISEILKKKIDSWTTKSNFYHKHDVNCGCEELGK